FTQLNTDGFGTANNTTIGDIKVLNNKVYVGTANATDGGQVWSIHIEADLSLTMSVDNSTPRTGDTVQYDLTLTNNGPETATGIGVTNTLSSDTSYTGSSIDLGSYDGSTGVWTIDSLASGGSANITIMATVTGTTAGTVITNSAEVTSTAITSDSDSTPNNAVTSEDDYASASSTIAAASTGGTSTIIGGGGGGGSSSEPAAEEPTEEPAEESTEEPEPGQCAGYTDVLDTDPDCEAIEYMQSIDAITGNPDGTFAPDGYLQRDQIAKISLETFGLFDDSEDYCGGENPFPDVDSNDWAYQHICRGVELGMIYGYSGGADAGYYRPARDVGRVEFLALILRNVSDSMPDDSLGSYNDVAGGQWFSGYAKYSYDNELFDGNTLFPVQATTRIEVARHVYELYLLGKI
ncbi:MAG: S-layer homology domain-containing protein, partial [Nitrospirota bacterium]